MSRRNRVRSMVIICILLISAVIFFTVWDQQKPISEGAVLVKCDESFWERGGWK